MALSTITLQSTINFCLTHVDLLPLQGVGGITDEPALTICREAAGEIITQEDDWKWNRVELSSPMQLTQGNAQPLVIYSSKQDYRFAGANAFTMNITPSGSSTQVQSTGASIDLAANNAVTVSGGTVTVNTLEPHRFVVGNGVYLVGLVAASGNAANAANYNSVFTDNGTKTQWTGNGFILTAVTSTSFSFAAGVGQNNGDVLGAPGIFNFAWATAGAILEVNNQSSPMNIRHVKASRNQVPWSKLADPEFFSVEKDEGNGILQVRMLYAPAAITWFLDIIYQQTPTLYTSLSQTWGIPDRYVALINQSVMYRAMRYIRSPSAPAEGVNLKAMLAAAKGADQAEEANVFLEPIESLIDYGPYWVGGGGY
jgi:hypothetical protein